MNTQAIQNKLEAEKYGIDIDTICMTTRGNFVKVKSFNAHYKGPGYCLSAMPWDHDSFLEHHFRSMDPFFISALLIKDENFLFQTPYVTNYHKISKLIPVKTLNIKDLEDIWKRFGMKAYCQYLYLAFMVKSFKDSPKEVNKKREEFKKFINESKNIFNDIKENSLINNGVRLF